MGIGRNEPCPCGSGRKYKQCCLGKNIAMPLYQKLLLGFAGLIVIVAIILVVGAIRNYQPHDGPTRVWSEEHQHWHNSQ